MSGFIKRPHRCTPTSWENARALCRHAATSSLQANGKSEPKCLPSREVEEPPAPLVCQDVEAFIEEFNVARDCQDSLGERSVPSPPTAEAAFEVCEGVLQEIAGEGIVLPCRVNAPAGQIELLTVIFTEGGANARCFLNTYSSCPTTIPERVFPIDGLTVASRFCGCPAVTIETLP